MTRTTKSLQLCFSTLTAIAFVAAVSISSIAKAGDSLLWYDGFVIGDEDGAGPNYVEGTIFNQQGGTGTFFADGDGDPNPWLPANADDPAADDSVIIPTSLTRPSQSLASTGGSASDAAGDGCCATSRTGRQFNSPLQTMDGTIYMGFLANFGLGNPTDPHYRSVEFWNAGVGDDFLNMSMGFSTFGNFDNPENGPAGGNQQLSLKVNGVRESFGAAVATNHQLAQHLPYGAQVGETHSVVLKFDLSTDDVEIGGVGDTVSVFINPELSDVNEPATPSLVVSGVDISLDRMSNIVLFHFAGTDPTNPGAFDELRVGSAWSDVAILSEDNQAPGIVPINDSEVSQGTIVEHLIAGGDAVDFYEDLEWGFDGPAAVAGAYMFDSSTGAFSFDTTGLPNGNYAFAASLTDTKDLTGMMTFNVSVVPEPAAALLMTLAMVGMGLVRRR